MPGHRPAQSVQVECMSSLFSLCFSLLKLVDLAGQGHTREFVNEGLTFFFPVRRSVQHLLVFKTPGFYINLRQGLGWGDIIF